MPEFDERMASDRRPSAAPVDPRAELDRLAAEVADLRAAEGRALPRLPGRKLRLVVLAIVLLIGFPLVARAADLFGDVPAGAAFHDDIEAIGLAGITTGCTTTTPPNFCPDDLVIRRAMAAFMHRGYGRVHLADQTTETTADLAFFSLGTSRVVTPGLPAGRLAGAAAFVKVDAVLTISTVTSGGSLTGCPCVFGGHIEAGGARIDGSGTEPSVTLSTGGAGTLPLTGVIRVTSSTRPTVTFTVSRSGGTGTWSARILMVTTYLPFGGAGGNQL